MIKLPSNYVPYDFQPDSLTMRPMKGAELADMSKAFISDDISFAIKAIGAVINVDVNQITIPDFYALMLHARYISMPKSTPMGIWKCQGSMYEDQKSKVQYSMLQLQGMMKAYELDKEHNQNPNDIMVETVACGIEHSVGIVESDFEFIELPADIEPLDPKFDYPRVRMLPQLTQALADPEICLTALAAQWLKDGDTLDEKLALMNAAPDLSLYDELSTLHAVRTYGVKQSVSKVCYTCGTEQPLVMVISPSIFFRVS